jgi:hypothetical protein
VSSFDTIESDGNDALLAMFGDAADYTDREGTVTEIASLSLTPREVRPDRSERGVEYIETAQALVARSELAQPARRAVITHNDVDWTIDSHEPAGPDHWMLQLSRSTAHSRDSGRYRSPMR